MALQKTIEFKGVSIENAYCKIINLNGSKSKIYYSIGIFISKDTSADENNLITVYSDEFVPSQDLASPRWDKQAYEDAKIKDFLKDAIDLLE